MASPRTRRVRLFCRQFYVDLRLTQIGDAWLASADTPDGPTLGWGALPINAAIMALSEPYAGVVEELLSSVTLGFEPPTS